MAKTDSDVVHCPIVGNKRRRFDSLLVDAINPFAHCILTNIDCWAGENG